MSQLSNNPVRDHMKWAGLLGCEAVLSSMALMQATSPPSHKKMTSPLSQNHNHSHNQEAHGHHSHMVLPSGVSCSPMLINKDREFHSSRLLEEKDMRSSQSVQSKKKHRKSGTPAKCENPEPKNVEFVDWRQNRWRCLSQAMTVLSTPMCRRTSSASTVTARSAVVTTSNDISSLTQVRSRSGVICATCGLFSATTWRDTNVCTVERSLISVTAVSRTSPEQTASCGTGACVSSASLRRRTCHAVRNDPIHRNLRSRRGAPYRPTTAAAGLQCDGFPKPPFSSVRAGWTRHSHLGTRYCIRLILETLGEGVGRVSSSTSTRSYSAIF
ncbi:zinc finger protein 740b isoform X2 [Ictalurus furcatus]|uniref:zinc finger protein 740b isoform X2 n=1 Tax=Ictalurus furcatus TaxID=66913 RepID=UPI0023501BB4|nr:zinc finger protein 740b isoform X2 [Ictalurus furcatus]